MLRNYAHHAQSLKSSVHSVHKMQGKTIGQTLKKLSYPSSFIKPLLQSHICEGEVDQSFFPERTINAVYMIGMIATIGFDRLCARRKRIGWHIGATGARIGPICTQGHAWPCTCADRPCQFLCIHMCTHTQNGFSDSPKQTACILFHGRYFIDTDETQFLRGTFSIAAHRLKFVCTLRKNSKPCA
jgi:hypothetical protein